MLRAANKRFSQKRRKIRNKAEKCPVARENQSIRSRQSWFLLEVGFLAFSNICCLFTLFLPLLCERSVCWGCFSLGEFHSIRDRSDIRDDATGYFFRSKEVSLVTEKILTWKLVRKKLFPKTTVIFARNMSSNNAPPNPWPVSETSKNGLFISLYRLVGSRGIFLIHCRIT